MTAPLIQLLANSPNQSLSTKSGNSYTSDAQGVVNNVLIGDVDSLLNLGCQIFDSSATLLGVLKGMNLNVTGDKALVMQQTALLIKWRPTKVTLENASVSLTTATAGLFTAAAAGGTAIVAAASALTGNSATTIANDLTIATTPGKTVFAAGTPLFLNVAVAQGAAATADIYVWGDCYP